MEASATILVIAGTGHQGSAVMDTVLSSPLRKGMNLRFMTRWPESTYAKKYISQGAQAYVGDLSDEDSVIKALQGVDRAFLVTHAAEGASSEKVHGIHFVQAAKKAGVKHIVFTSAAGVELESDVPSFKAKWQVGGSPFQRRVPSGEADWLFYGGHLCRSRIIFIHPVLNILLFVHAAIW
jgi:uncharacterized protein YbjT (DUF2867 family)